MDVLTSATTETDFFYPYTTIHYALSENCYFRPFVLLPLQSTKQTRPVVKQEITAPAYKGVT